MTRRQRVNRRRMIFDPTGVRPAVEDVAGIDSTLQVDGHAVRDPRPQPGTGKVHIRRPDGLLGCRIGGTSITEPVLAADLARMSLGDLCRKCWPVNQAVILR